MSKNLLHRRYDTLLLIGRLSLLRVTINLDVDKQLTSKPQLFVSSTVLVQAAWYREVSDSVELPQVSIEGNDVQDAFVKSSSQSTVGAQVYNSVIVFAWILGDLNLVV